MMLCDEFIVYELPNAELANGKFGVLRQSNCPSHSVIPRKLFRFPYQGFGGHVTGMITYVNELRAKRPNAGDVHEFLSLIESRDSANVFESVVNGLSPEVIIAEGDHVQPENLSLIQPSTQELSSVLAATVINPYPGGFRCFDEYVKGLMDHNPLILPNSYNHMISLVSFVTQFPDLTDCHQQLAYTPVEYITALLSTMRASIKGCVEQLSKWGINDVNVMPVMNLGGYAGATQDGLHCHIHLDLTGTGHDTKYEGLLKSAQEPGEHLIYENNNWSLYVVNAPERNYQLTFLPKRGVQRFQELTNFELNDLGETLKIADLALNEAGIANHRNITFRPLYEGYDCEGFRFSGDIYPFELIGGLEMTGNMRIAKINPFEAASNLRMIINNLKDTGLSTQDYAY